MPLSLAQIIDEINAKVLTGGRRTIALNLRTVLTEMATASDAALKYKGRVDLSSNPNYPAGLVGDWYSVSVSGKIGGTDGKALSVDGVYYCIADNAGGNQATVGSSWSAISVNVSGFIPTEGNTAIGTGGAWQISQQYATNGYNTMRFDTVAGIANTVSDDSNNIAQFILTGTQSNWANGDVAGNLSQVLLNSDGSFSLTSAAASGLSSTRIYSGADGSINLSSLLSTDPDTLQIARVAANDRFKVYVKPLDYAADYSGSYTSRSLIDKGYADSVYAPITGDGYLPLTGGSGYPMSGSILFGTALGIDTSGAGTLNIGNANATIINIGRTGVAVNILGDTLYENVTNLTVTDKLITLNKGGATTSGNGVGFEVEENSLITGYLKVSSARTGFDLLAPGSAGVLTLVPGGSNKTLTAGNTGTIAVTSDLSSYMPLNGANITGQNFSLTSDNFNIQATTQVVLDASDGVHEAVVSAEINAGYALTQFAAGLNNFICGEDGSSFPGFDFQNNSSSIFKITTSGLTAAKKISFSGTTQAGLRLNNLTTTQKNALTGQSGDLIWDSVLGKAQIYTGSAWADLATGGSGTVTSVTSADANATVATTTTTPVITIVSAPKLATARAINGVNFDGTATITVTADANTLTGTTLHSTVVSSSLTSVGTIATGVWNGTIVTGTYGGTGVNNGSFTITLAGNLVTTGAFNTTFAQAASTTVTLPSTSSTMARTDAAQSFTGIQTFTSGINFGINQISYLDYGSSGSQGLTSRFSGTEQFTMIFSNAGTLGGTANTSGGRCITIFDRVATAYRGGINASGFLAWGSAFTPSAMIHIKAAASTIGFRISQTSGTSNTLEIGDASSGTLSYFDSLGRLFITSSTSSTSATTGALVVTGAIGTNGLWSSANIVSNGSINVNADLSSFGSQAVSGTDQAGYRVVVSSGAGTGAGTLSYLSFQTPSILTSGTTVQSFSERLRIASDSLLCSVDFKLNTAGNGIYVKEGSNATMGVATLSAGSVTVSTTKVTANSRIFLEVQSLGTVSTPTTIAVTSRSAGTSFTITSSNVVDTSTIAWIILEPA